LTVAILNQPAVDAANSAINAGRVNRTDNWSMSDEDEAALLGPYGDDWEAYSLAFLGLRGTPTTPTDKANYLYGVSKLVGDRLTLFRDALVGVIEAAGQIMDQTIVDTAQELLDQVDGRPEETGEPTETTAAPLAIRASLKIDAQADGADRGKRPRVVIDAYGGGPMTVPGFGPLVLDLAGLSLPDSLPLLAQHENTLDAVAGAGSPRVESGRLVIRGTLAGSEAGRRVAALLEDSVPLQASVGVTPGDRVKVRPGERVEVNGRTIEAGKEGLSLVKSGALREVSILPLGADSSTSIHVAAKASRRKAVDINIDFDPARDERERILKIKATCRNEFPMIENQAIRDGWTLEETKGRVLDAIRASRSSGPSMIHGLPAAGFKPGETLQAACMLFAGQGEAVVKAFRNGEQLANTIEAPHGWAELCAMALRLEGQHIPSNRMEMIKAAFTTVSMPTALGSSIEKLALNPFLELSENWMAISRIVPAKTFRQGKAVRIAASTALQLVPSTGELKSGPISEDTFTYQMNTYGKIFGLSRQAIINDDAGILADTPQVLGSEAARTVSDLFFSVVIGAQAAGYFSSANNNLLTGSLDIIPIAAAVAALASQRDADNRVLNLQPKTLLVPAALRFLGTQALVSDTLQRNYTSDQVARGNPLADYGIQIRSEARLDVDSPKNWYLYAPVLWAPMLVAALDGRLGINVESMPMEANYLGMQWRGYLDVGVSLGEQRAAVKSIGS
jgi:hypothetical protein